MDARRNQATVSSELEDRAIPMACLFPFPNLVLIGEDLHAMVPIMKVGAECRKMVGQRVVGIEDSSG
jgi:hypothetical protein